MYVPIVFIFMIILLEGCSYGKPVKTEAPKENTKKFEYCMKEGKTAGQSLESLANECRRYIETSELKNKAVAKCVKWKNNEIGWTEKEIDIYCNKFWRGYK